jgi:hypothetical protein
MTKEEIFEAVDIQPGDQVWIVVNRGGASSLLQRYNFGYPATSLLGICELTKHDIILQMKGKIQPDEIKREFSKEPVTE